MLFRASRNASTGVENVHTLYVEKPESDEWGKYNYIQEFRYMVKVLKPY